MGEAAQRPRHLSDVISSVYGMDFVNAKKVIDTKIKHQQPNPENLSLADRIRLNRRKGGKPPEQKHPDSTTGSVDISDLTNQNDDKRTPTPEPTMSNNRKSPLKRQETKQSIASEQPGPSHRKSATPPLPPIKTASPRPESKKRTPVPVHARQNKVESRRETPILPPIARNEPRRDEPRRESPKYDSGDEIQPPKDMREFDPDIGIGEETVANRSPTPPRDETPKSQRQAYAAPQENKAEMKEQSPKKKTPEPVREKTPKTQQTPPPPPPKQKTPPPPEQPTINNTETTVVPVVAPLVAAAASERHRSRSRSRSRDRDRSRSRSRSRSKKRSRRKSRNRSRSRSNSRRRRRSRRRYTSSSSYNSSYSPRRRRRHSYSPGRHRHRSRGRSRSRRRSFDYDFERAKSIVRSISRMGSFSRARHRSPSVEYILGGNPSYWPPVRHESPRRKKKIIIVQNGGLPHSDKHRDRGSSGSEVNIVVANPPSKSKKKKHKKSRVKYVKKVVSSDTEESSESSDSEVEIVKKDRKKKTNIKQKSNRNKKNKYNSDESEEETKKKNIRFNLKGTGPEKSKKSRKKSTISSDENEPIKAQVYEKQNHIAPVVESISDVQSGVTNHKQPPRKTQTPLVPKSPNTAWNTPRQSPMTKSPSGNNPVKRKNNKNDENELLETLNQLDKRSDFEIEQLKGGNQRKMPPDVNTEMKKKIFSKEFQRSIDNFLES